MKEPLEGILSHLLFHKSLIDEEGGQEKIDRYIEIVQEIDQGMHAAVCDPFEKAIVAAFELVVEQELDPWDIDLVSFTDMYLKRVREDGEVHFLTAGGLLYLAWRVLRLQSDEAVERAQAPTECVEPAYADWDLGAMVYQSPEEYDFTQAVLQAKTPLQDPFGNRGERPVSLMELVDAFGEANDEIDRLRLIREARARLQAGVVTDFSEEIHSEDLLQEIQTTWERIRGQEGTPIRFRDLHGSDLWDKLTVFVSLLYLMKLEKIRLWQESLPNGDILMERTAEALSSEEVLVRTRPETATVPEAKLEAMVA